jgi:hypothetical protein
MNICTSKGKPPPNPTRKANTGGSMRERLLWLQPKKGIHSSIE